MVDMVCKNDRTNRDARVASSPDTADAEPIHTCCIGLLNGTNMRKNGGTDVRPTKIGHVSLTMPLLGVIPLIRVDIVSSLNVCKL